MRIKKFRAKKEPFFEPKKKQPKQIHTEIIRDQKGFRIEHPQPQARGRHRRPEKGHRRLGAQAPEGHRGQQQQAEQGRV